MLFNRKIGPLTFNEGWLIGQGNAGNVYKGKIYNSYLNQYQTNNIKNQDSEIQVAVKVIPLSSVFQNQVTQYLFNSEKLALNLLKNEYIIKCYGIFQDNFNSYITTEFITHGTLKQYIKQRKDNKVYENVALDITSKLLKALKTICENGFVHRDLKPANIMLRKKQNSQFMDPIIIDFGFAQNMRAFNKPSIFYNVGSPSYMAPESFNFTKYSQKSDLWSIGVILYEMLSGQLLDKDMLINQFFFHIQQIIRQKINKIRPHISQNTSRILEKMLNVNENTRGTASEIIQQIQKQLSQVKVSFFSVRNKPTEKIDLLKKKNFQVIKQIKQKPKFNAKTFFKKNSQNQQQALNQKQNNVFGYSTFNQKRNIQKYIFRTRDNFRKNLQPKQAENLNHQNLSNSKQLSTFVRYSQLQNPQQIQINHTEIGKTNTSLSKSKVQFQFQKTKISRVLSQSSFYLTVK